MVYILRLVPVYTSVDVPFRLQFTDALAVRSFILRIASLRLIFSPAYSAMRLPFRKRTVAKQPKP